MANDFESYYTDTDSIKSINRENDIEYVNSYIAQMSEKIRKEEELSVTPFIIIDYFNGIIPCRTIGESLNIGKCLNRHEYSYRILANLETGLYAIVGPMINGKIYFYKLEEGGSYLEYLSKYKTKILRYVTSG